MERVLTPEPTEPRRGSPDTGSGVTSELIPEVVPGAALVGASPQWALPRLPPSSLLALQRLAGNAATSAMIQRKPAPPRGPAPAPVVVQREVGGAATSAKHTVKFPDLKLMKKEAGYVEVEVKASGSVDYEITAPPPPATAPKTLPTTPPPSPAGPIPLPSPGGPEVSSSGGASISDEGLKYQAEVGLAWEKRATGIFEGMTPKAKVGGETSADGGKLGVEMSLEGEKLEPKFGFTLAEMDAQKGIKFATMEAGVDWKIKEWEYTATDGAKLKVTPKATLTVSIEPNYERIFLYLVEQGGATVAAEALVAGSIIFIGAFTIVGFIMTLGEGEAYAQAIDEAGDVRKKLVEGFTAGATAQDTDASDKFMAKGLELGRTWRADLKAGKKGTPVPDVVIDEKSRENQARIRSSAEQSANQVVHNALVVRYWDIHYVQRNLPWAEIDTIYSMLMEGQGFGKPEPQEGKNYKPPEGEVGLTE
jgi:hypothetical protein